MATMANSKNSFCLTVRWWAKWPPMLWLWRVVGFPSWGCRVQPCTMGWRRIVPRWWVRLLPRPVGQWLCARLPRWATEADVSPDCFGCQRFRQAAARSAAQEVLPNARPI